MIQPKMITTKEANEIKNAIVNKDKSILLVGGIGTGKTTVLNELLNSSKNSEELVVDGTIKNGEYIFLKEHDVYNLYHTCLIIQKILLNIRKKYLNKFIEAFAFFDMYVRGIINEILFMNMTNSYKSSAFFMDKPLYEMPEILIATLLLLISKNLDIKDMALIIDDFDKVGESSQRYQEFIYKRVRRFLNVIMTVSDKEVVNDAVTLENLKKENRVIKLDYSSDLEVVKEILDQEVNNILRSKKHYEFKYRLRFILSDETILSMIEKTNGNLFDMLRALRMLYSRIDELSVSECNRYILDYIDNENSSLLISGITIPKRVLHIK